MQRSHAAQDVLDTIRDCVGANCRRFQFARTRGIPPADCASITVSWIDSEDTSFGDCTDLGGCQSWQSAHGLRVVITDVCMGPDSGKGFDWVGEDEAAACFDDLVDDIERCLKCADWTQFRFDHSAEVSFVDTAYDIEAQGGGYSAYIQLSIVSDECC